MNWETLRWQVLRRDEFLCQYCGERPAYLQVVSSRGARMATLHVDHMFPLSKGGRNILENLVTACAPCNLKKSDKIWYPPLARCAECKAWFVNPDCEFIDRNGPIFTCKACAIESESMLDPTAFMDDIELEVATWDELASAVGF